MTPRGMIKHSLKGFPDEKSWSDSLENLLLNAVDEIERARLNPKIGYGPNSASFAQQPTTRLSSCLACPKRIDLMKALGFLFLAHFYQRSQKVDLCNFMVQTAQASWPQTLPPSPTKTLMLVTLLSPIATGGGRGLNPGPTDRIAF